MTASPATVLPTQLDLRALAREAAGLTGSAPLAGFERLATDLPDVAGGLGQMDWQVHVEWREPVAPAGALERQLAGGPQLWLHLLASARVPQTCQRCLAPYVQAVEVDRWFRFVADEATALAEDDESEEDVLVFAPRFNLQELVEDELLMALPLVPMHEVCPEPVRLNAGDDTAPAAERPNPFAVLAQLKPSGQPDGHKGS